MGMGEGQRDHGKAADHGNDCAHVGGIAIRVL